MAWAANRLLPSENSLSNNLVAYPLRDSYDRKGWIWELYGIPSPQCLYWFGSRGLYGDRNIFTTKQPALVGPLLSHRHKSTMKDIQYYACIKALMQPPMSQVVFVMN